MSDGVFRRVFPGSIRSNTRLLGDFLTNPRAMINGVCRFVLKKRFKGMSQCIDREDEETGQMPSDLSSLHAFNRR